MSNATRPHVTKIIVEFSDGTTREFPGQDEMPIGLFWEDFSVIQILGGYYGDGTGHTMTYDELKANFGETRANAVCQPGQTIPVTKDVIETLWNTPGDDGKLLGVMLKLPRTKSGG